MGTDKRLAIGDVAPQFKLKGVDLKEHSLMEYRDKKVLAVVFTCNHCPYAQAYEDRLMALQAELGGQGAQLVAINSNEDLNYPEDSFEAMVTRAADKRFNYPYLRDLDQSVARAYGAIRTPHLFVFDGQRRLSYTGRIDDNWQQPDRVKSQDLRQAMLTLLQDGSVAQPETYAIGCTIKWLPRA